MKIKVYFENLGCAKNIVDSSVIAGHLIDRGYSITYSPEDADIIVVNTCSFIKPAVKESYEVIENYIKNKGKRKIFVTGCLVERDKGNIQKLFPDIDGVWGTGELGKFIHLVQGKDFRKTHRKGDISFCAYPDLFTPPHYTYIKIADGCNHRCSFCIIPHLKGRYKSKPMEMILREVSLLPDTVKEINLIAQDTTYYGMDIYKRFALLELLEKIDKIFRGWIRILYAHPLHITNDLLDAIASLENVVPYIDVPFQHISNKVLKRMRRGYRKNDVIKIVEAAEKRGIAIRTAFITGFPGEGEKEFQKLISFISQYKITRTAIFPYFSEEGAVASRFNAIPEKKRWERVEMLQDIISEISFRENQNRIGRRVQVLVDGKENGKFYGRTAQDAPDIDEIVWIKGNARQGKFINVKIEDAEDFALYSSPQGADIIEVPGEKA